MINIILCGGSGTRLWPLSRTLMPKQFVELFDGESLFQKTVERNRAVCQSQFVVSNADQYFLARDQIETVEGSGRHSAMYMLEPVGRNTAPAIALACLALDPDDLVLVTPSDHLIRNEQAYQEAVASAKLLAEKGGLVTFGITPNYPETGFGYIEADGDTVKSFKEKPDFEVAQAYLAAGNFYWNSGMFCFKAGIFLDELQLHSPALYQASREAFGSHKNDDGRLIRIAHDLMMAIPEDSIDYAVMEKSDKVQVVPADMGWSDLGSFDALYEELPKDPEGNTENDHHIAIGSTGNLVVSDRTIATIDVDDLLIVDTDDALLISKKGSSQKVKKVVAELKRRDSHLPQIHITAHRPWGTYTVLEDTPGYKIKRIVVKPGNRLSLQKHFHRNEHWIVVSGTAMVTVGEESYLVRPNESTYIRMGDAHRLANPGKIDLVLIEAQVGEYTGEDDIVRISDDFKRN